VLDGRKDHRRDDRLVDPGNPAGVRQLGRAVDLMHFAVSRRHAVQTPGRGRHEIDVELPFQPLLHDLHVQEPQEAAPETEAERDRRLGLVEERRVVQPQLLERVAQLRILVAFDRIEAGEHHRLQFLEAGNGSSVRRLVSVIVSPIFASLIFLTFATMKPTSPTPSSRPGLPSGEDAELFGLVVLPSA
jgi:hypothetical protein